MGSGTGGFRLGSEGWLEGRSSVPGWRKAGHWYLLVVVPEPTPAVT